MIKNDYIPFSSKILEVIQHTNIEYTFRMEYQGDVKPGQFFEVSIPKYGEAPISVSGVGKNHIDLTIRRVGKVTNEIFKRYVGNSLLLRGPYGFPELTAEYSERKKEIYFLQNNQEAYIRQLWELLLVHKPGDLKLFQELKKQYPKDIWEKERMKILDTLPPDVPAEELYCEEKMYDRLLDIVLDAPGLELVIKYEEILKLKYP